MRTGTRAHQSVRTASRELTLTRRQDDIPDVAVTLASGDTVSDATMREALYQLGIADLQEPLTTDAAGDPTRGEQQSDDLARHTGAVEKLTPKRTTTLSAQSSRARRPS